MLQTPATFLPKFIVDTPAPSDQMAAHGRIAAAIARTVLGDQVKIIGVLGDWGSGKSTVISLVQTALSEKPAPMACFTFDAWRHQSDPHRRAFLEALIDSLDKSKAYAISDEAKRAWWTEIEKLNRQREQTETETKPRVSGWTAAFALCLLFAPLAHRLIGDGTLSAADGKDPAAASIFIAGWCLVAAPLVLAGLFLGLSAFKPSLVRNSTLFAVLANKGAESKVETRIKDVEPSAIEFQRVFKTIVQDAQKHGPRLVIVVDNLDRLPPLEAMTIWSTVRSLFLGVDGARVSDALDCPSLKLPAIIMPLDEKAIQTIYKSVDTAEGVLAKSFIDKTFDVVFRIPKPVLSKRHDYLAVRLSEVFQTHVTTTDIHAVGTVYEASLTLDAPPSPRAINSFVNELAALAMQRPADEIPLPLVALYVLNRAAIGEDLHLWMGRKSEALASFGDMAQMGLAALHYGVALDAAQELFIDQPLGDAVHHDDLEAFERLAALPGFGRYLLQTLDRAPHSVDGFPVFVTAKLLAHLATEDDWARDAWNKLRALAPEALTSEALTARDVAGLAWLLASCHPNQLSLFVGALAHAADAATYGLATPDTVHAFADAAKQIIQSAETADLAEFRMPVPGGLHGFASMTKCHFEDQEMRRLVLSGANERQYPAWLSAHFNDPLDVFSIALLTEGLSKRWPDLDWSPLLDASRVKLINSEPDQTAAAVGVLLALAKNSKTADDLIRSWGDDGWLRSAFSTISQHDKNEALPAGAALLMRLGAEMPLANQGWEDRLSSDFDLVEQIDDALVSLNVPVSLAWLEARLDRWGQDAPLLKQLLLRLLHQDRIPPSEIFERPAVLNRLLDPVTAAAQWARLGEAPDMQAFVEGGQIQNTAPALSALMDKDAARWRPSLLYALTVSPDDHWRHALEHGGPLVDLLAQLPGKPSQKQNLGPNAFQALTSTISAVFPSDNPDFRRHWRMAADWMAPTARRQLRDDIARTMLSLGGPPDRLLAAFNELDPDLVESKIFSDQAERAVAYLVMQLISTDTGRAWLYENRDVTAKWVAQSPLALQDDLRVTLARYRDAGYGTAEDLSRAYRLPR